MNAEYDLVVYDESFNDAANEFKNRGQKIEDLLNNYIDILQRVVDGGIKEGQVHDNLESFIKSAENLKGTASNLASIASECVEGFIEDIDTVDSYLY